jgi:hypothetical protein
MPQTTKRTAKPADPAKLAAAFVKDRLAFCWSYVDFTDATDTDTEVREKFNAIVEAARAQDWPEVTHEMIETLAQQAADVHEDALLATKEPHARAGFLVDLELGRRLGGAR